jgi:hypothetical protein
METKNLIGMLAGYYLSRFDSVAYKRFPRTSQAEVHTYLADRIGVPASSVKLWRDEFDPIHPNSRKGWHKRRMAPSRVRMAEMLEGVSEAGVYRLLEDCMQNPVTDVIAMLEQADTEQDDTAEAPSSRGVTGVRAEQLFVDWFGSEQTIFNGPLKDCRQLQCGYDFEVHFEGGLVFVEVKGLKGEIGGVLLTDKEWSTANNAGDKYFLVLIRNVDSSSPQVEVFRNPAANLQPEQCVTTVIQVSWRIKDGDLASVVNQPVSSESNGGNRSNR